MLRNRISYALAQPQIFELETLSRVLSYLNSLERFVINLCFVVARCAAVTFGRTRSAASRVSRRPAIGAPLIGSIRALKGSVIPRLPRLLVVCFRPAITPGRVELGARSCRTALLRVVE